MAMLNLRLLAVKLHEGNDLFARLPTLLPDWKKDIDRRYVESIEKLTLYFSQKPPPLITLIRHKLGAHSDPKLILRALSSVEDDELLDFQSGMVGNTLYMSAELITAHVFLELARISGMTELHKPHEAVDAAFDSCMDVVSLMNDACQGYHMWFLEKYIFPFRHAISENDFIELTNLPDLMDVKLPFFTSYEQQPPE